MDSMPDDHTQPQCPSAQPDWKGSVVFGIVEGSPQDPRVTYLPRTLPITPELLKLTEPVLPTEVLRFAAPCVRQACQHFNNGACRLVTKTVQNLRVVSDDLPACQIRESCRWHQQEGRSACMRCPQVVTDRLTADPALRQTADPAK